MADSNGVSLSDSQLSSDSGVQTNDSNVESQLTESKIMKAVSYTHLDVYKRQISFYVKGLHMMDVYLAIIFGLLLSCITWLLNNWMSF